MKKQIIETADFRWTYWPCEKTSSRTMIVALGGASDRGPLFSAAVKTMHAYGCNAATFVPVIGGAAYDGWHDFPLEKIQEIARWLLGHSSTHVGIAGASTTSLVSLAAVSRIPEITLVLSFATEDYNTEGIYVGKVKGGLGMSPAVGCSMLSWQGKPVPYSPTGLSDEAFAAMMRKDAEGNMVNTLELCRYYESLPGFEEALHPVEQAHALICAFGADTDVGCNSGDMVRRLEKRLQAAHYRYGMEMHVYPVCSHYQFPTTMVKKAFPLISQFLFGKMWAIEKSHPKECIAAREDIEDVCRKAIAAWQPFEAVQVEVRGDLA